MRTVFHPFLPNGPAGDPALWVDLLDEGSSVLVDVGDLRQIPTRKLLRVDRIVVTHTHMDHFAGFDHLLRVVLGREKELTVTGPTGFLACMRGKMSAYTWNLIGSYPIRLIAEEVDGEQIRAEIYTGSALMQPEALPSRPLDQATGTIHAHRAYTMHVATLDHGIPVLGVALHETEGLSVNEDRLRGLGLVPGPWLRDLKQAVRRGEPRETEIAVLSDDPDATHGRTMNSGELADEILFRRPGRKLAYVTDLRHTGPNVEAVVRLAAGADLLICETAFLHQDEQLARERSHLTARQAGELARAAGVGKLAPFHFSPRYVGREQELLDEAAAAFGGPVVSLPSGPHVEGGLS